MNEFVDCSPWAVKEYSAAIIYITTFLLELSLAGQRSFLVVAYKVNVSESLKVLIHISKCH